ncbi:MAG TPA: hypothetical protein VFV98_04915 [Vicinamibacterales bacterium]|nr:hypothetical protein [Vicinamibacterales bacterium]
MDGKSSAPPLLAERWAMPPGVGAMRPPPDEAADREEPPGAVRPLERGKSIEEGPSARPAPPPELIPLAPAPPVELEPDEPDEPAPAEPADPVELEPVSGRGIAWAPAETGSANAIAKVSVEPKTIDLAMVVPPTGGG